jgi:hypothetical protein
MSSASKKRHGYRLTSLETQMKQEFFKGNIRDSSPNTGKSIDPINGLTSNPKTKSSYGKVKVLTNKEIVESHNNNSSGSGDLLIEKASGFMCHNCAVVKSKGFHLTTNLNNLKSAQFFCCKNCLIAYAKYSLDDD